MVVLDVWRDARGAPLKSSRFITEIHAVTAWGSLDMAFVALGSVRLTVFLYLIALMNIELLEVNDL